MEVVYADGSGVTAPWFNMNGPADNIVHAADPGRMTQFVAVA